MCEACGTCGEMRNTYRILVAKSEEEGTTWETRPRYM